MKKNRKSTTKKGIIKIMVLCIILILIIALVLLKSTLSENNKTEKIIKKERTIELSEYVITNKDIPLYYLENNKYKKIGIIGKNITLQIEPSTDNYYKINNLDSDYYVKTNGLANASKVEYDSRYKNYIVFNQNIETKEKTNFYDKEGNLIYSFNKSYSLPIVIKDTNKYGVEFANQVLYVNKDEVNIIDKDNTELQNTNSIGVLNYHFFYDDSVESERNNCNQSICTSTTQFKKHLDYIKNNNYFTPTMEELEMYIDGKIQLPKSIVITIDDGWRVKLGSDLLTEYQLNATVFLVTSWYDPKSYVTDYVEVHSHSDNMHNQGDCSMGQGGGIQCLAEDYILNDLKISSEKLNGSKVFCYPFYEYNDYSISMLKKAGYTMAFAGESTGSNNMVQVGSNKYSLPRFIIVNYTTMEDFAAYLEGKSYS